MLGDIAGAMLGRRLARQAGHSGLLGASAGIGISILLHRLAPKIGHAAFQECVRQLQRRRTARAADDDIQSAGA